MNCENEKYIHRRLSGSNSELRRTRSVRASFRLLGSRWKPLTNRNNDGKDLIQSTNSNKGVLDTKKPSDKVKNQLNEIGKVKTNHKYFRAFSKENVAVISVMPGVTVPTKTASAVLKISGIEEDFNRNTCDFLLSADNLRVLKRSLSMKSVPPAAGQRTATIRRGSVWANSASSKFLIIFDHFFLSFSFRFFY